MKYGIRTRSLNMPWHEALVAAGRVGFDGVELVARDEDDIAGLLTQSGKDQVLSWCRDAGCVVSSISAAPFRHYSFARRKKTTEESIRFVSDCLHACVALNARAVLFPHFDRQNIDINPEEEADFISGFEQCASIAEKLGVYAALETSFSVEQLLRIVDGVNSPNVGVYYDVANAMIYGHDPVDMLTRLNRRVSMIHVKEKDAELLGEGAVDWGRFVSAMGEIGYDGWLVFETAPTDQPRAAAEQNLRFMRSTMAAWNSSA